MNAVVLALALAAMDPAPAARVAPVAPATPDLGAPSPKCRGQLDAAAPCRSPAWEPAVVVADTTPEPPALVRDPKMFPGELMFVSTLIGLAGGGLLTGALTQPAGDNDGSRLINDGLFYGGVTALSLSGLVAGAALSTWVFDPSTGTLRLPIFDGEPR